jgi:hypothetical protein
VVKKRFYWDERLELNRRPSPSQFVSKAALA